MAAAALSAEDCSALEELLSAPSKQAVNELFTASFDSLHDPMPAARLAAIAESLQLDGGAERARDVVLSAQRVISRALYASETKEQIISAFPEGFHPQLAALIAQVVRHHAEHWRGALIASAVSSASRLVTLQCGARLCVPSTAAAGVSGEAHERRATPVVDLDLLVQPPREREGDARALQSIALELSEAQLDAALDGLRRVREQLEHV